MTRVIGGREAGGFGSDLRLAEFELWQVDAAAAMLSRCSPATLVDRFHGVTDGSAHMHHLAGRDDHVTHTAWWERRCIGMATLARGGPEFDLGVLVEDVWQRAGIGRALVSRLFGAGRDAGMSECAADILVGREFLLHALARVAGPLAVEVDHGVYRAHFTLADRVLEPSPPCLSERGWTQHRPQMGVQNSTRENVTVRTGEANLRPGGRLQEQPLPWTRRQAASQEDLVAP